MNAFHVIDADTTQINRLRWTAVTPIYGSGLVYPVQICRRSSNCDNVIDCNRVVGTVNFKRLYHGINMFCRHRTQLNVILGCHQEGMAASRRSPHGCAI